MILPAENRQSVEEDLTADQIEGVRIHYASRIEDVLAVALPKSVSEEKKDEAVRETLSNMPRSKTSLHLLEKAR